MNLLAIGIHPDDVELGCGGTVILAAQDGHAVTLADLSEGTASTNGTPEERAREGSEAADIMGVKKRINLALPDTGIRAEDPEQTKRTVAAIRDVQPDVILIPSSDDPHPDHASGGELVKRAIYLAGLSGYEPGEKAWSVRNVMVYGGRVDIDPDVIVDVTSVHKKKMLAIGAHQSQFVQGAGTKPTPLNAPEFLPALEARDRLHGRKIRVQYGEGFRLLNPIALSGLSIFDT
jgi:bacillithiol biosynthesis deacetylase BshB1